MASDPCKTPPDAGAETVAAPRIADGFPRLILRLMPAVYARSNIEFTADSGNVGSAEGGAIFRILDPSPDAGETLTPERRQAVIDVASRMAKGRNHCVCAGFSPRDTVYVWPGIAPVASTHLPITDLTFPGHDAFLSSPTGDN